MICLDDVFNVLNDGRLVIISQDEKDKLLIFQKGDLLFVFNFHPSKSFENYRVGTGWSTPHKIVLDTDEGRFFGKDRLDYGHKNSFPSIGEPWMNRSNYIQMYLPSRTCIILCAEENIGRYDVGRLGKINIID
jgi:1,4-alpha-glucan branching enzyme